VFTCRYSTLICRRELEHALTDGLNSVMYTNFKRRYSHEPQYFGQQDSGHPLIRHYSTRLWILRDAKLYENYIIFFFFFTFCDVILCNFLHYVTFTFFNVYVLETLRLVTQNVWWCYMKCDVYVVEILRMVQYTLCATTYRNITSCDVNVRLRYVM
jgi:hypothetical protein